MLGSLHDSQKKDWRKYVKPLTHAYNCMVNETTGYSPYFLLFGRHARLPIDVLYGTDPDVTRTKEPTQYVRDLKERLEYAYKLVQENTKKAAAKNKGYYDKRAKASTLQKGDRVLVRKVAIKGKQKLADRWEPGVYVVKSKLKDIPVYVVEEEGRSGKTRTLHRNLLLSCGSLPAAEISHDAPTRMQTRSRGIEDTDADPEDGSDIEIEMGSPPEIEIRFDPRLDARTPAYDPRPQVEVLDDFDDHHNCESETSHPGDSEETTAKVVSHEYQSSDESDSLSDSEGNVSQVSDCGVNVESQGLVDPEQNEGLVDLNKTPIDTHDSVPPTQVITRPPERLGPSVSEVRRSSRTRQPPTKMTYDTLGEPTIHLMQWYDWAKSFLPSSSSSGLIFS